MFSWLADSDISERCTIISSIGPTKRIMKSPLITMKFPKMCDKRFENGTEFIFMQVLKVIRKEENKI